METAKISKCGCNNPGQDELYGEKNRVFNMSTKLSEKKGELGEYSCSVCASKIKLIN